MALQPVSTVPYEEAVRESRSWCFTTLEGVAVYTTRDAVCPDATEISESTRVATARVSVPVEIAFGLELVIVPHYITCGRAGPVRGCSLFATALVYQKAVPATWVHELGHFIILRTGLDSGGDPQLSLGDPDHNECSFWLRLCNFECPMLRSLRK